MDQEISTDLTTEQLNAINYVHDHWVNYTQYTVAMRIPLLQDGLTPDVRRLLYGIITLNKTTFTKNTNAIGETVKFHPHGESSVYGTLLNVSTDYYNRYPLLDFKGFYGSLSSPASAMRYTESKLSTFIRELLSDTFKYVKKYPEIFQMPSEIDNSYTEPKFLITLLPICFINSYRRIGSGFGINYPLLNLKDLINSICNYLESGTFLPINVDYHVPITSSLNLSEEDYKLKFTLKGKYSIIGNNVIRLFSVPFNKIKKLLTLINDPDAFNAVGISKVDEIGKTELSFPGDLGLKLYCFKPVEDVLEKLSYCLYGNENYVLLTRLPEVAKVSVHQFLTFWTIERLNIEKLMFELDKKEEVKKLKSVEAKLFIGNHFDQLVNISKNSLSEDLNDEIKKYCNENGILDEDQISSIISGNLKSIHPNTLKKLQKDKESLLSEIERIDDILNDDEAIKLILSSKIKKLLKFALDSNVEIDNNLIKPVVVSSKTKKSNNISIVYDTYLHFYSPGSIYTQATSTKAKKTETFEYLLHTGLSDSIIVLFPSSKKEYLVDDIIKAKKLDIFNTSIDKSGTKAKNINFDEKVVGVLIRSKLQKLYAYITNTSYGIATGEKILKLTDLRKIIPLFSITNQYNQYCIFLSNSWCHIVDLTTIKSYKNFPSERETIKVYDDFSRIETLTRSDGLGNIKLNKYDLTSKLKKIKLPHNILLPV